MHWANLLYCACGVIVGCPVGYYWRKVKADA